MGAAPGSDVKRFDRRDLGLTALVAIVALLFQWPMLFHWLGLLDEGYILAIADDINRGRALYRDVNVDAPFPAAFHLLAGWFDLAGTSIASSRVLAAGCFAVYVASMYRISRAVVGRGASLVVVLALLSYRVWAFPHWQVYSYSSVAATLSTLAVAVLVGWVGRRGIGRLLLAGAAIGVAILAKQNTGLAVGGSLGLALLVLPWLESEPRPPLGETIRFGLVYAAAVLAVLAPAFVLIGMQGALPDMFEQTVLFTMNAMEKADYPRLPDLWPFWGQDEALRADIGSYFPAILATLWWYACPDCWVSEMSRGPLYHETAFWDVTLKLVYWSPILLFVLVAGLWLAEGPRNRQRVAVRLLVFAFAGGALLGFSPPRDWVHLMMVYPPFFVLAAVLVEWVAGRLPAVLSAGLRGAVVLGVVVSLLVSVALVTDLRRQTDWPLTMSRAGVYADRQNGPIIEDVVSWIDRSAPDGAPVPVFPMQPMLGFLAGRTALGGYHVIWPYQAEKRDHEIIEEIESAGVEHVVYSFSQYQHLRTFRENAPALYRHLVENFEIDEVFSREPFGPLLAGLRRRESSSGTLLLSAAESVSGMERVLWPFGEVLTHPVGGPDDRGGVEMLVLVPADAPVLATEVGVNPDRWLGFAAGPIEFILEAEGAGGGAEPVRRVRLEIDPGRKIEDRRWHPLSIDLAPWAGERVRLRLSMRTSAAEPEPLGLAGWREPGFRATEP